MTTRPANPGKVVELVADFYYLTVHDITHGSREPTIVRARTMTVAMLRDLCGFSWGEAVRRVGYANPRDDGSPGGDRGVAYRVRHLDPVYVTDVREFVLRGLSR